MALRPTRSGTARIALLAAMAGLAATAARGTLARFEITEDSMEPALSAGDYLFAAKVGSIKRGDIVIYADPARSGIDLVKRVVGLEGETVSIAAGQVAINGAVLAEPWADGPTLPDSEWTIAPGTLFTLGDNRRMSAGDSRASGPVSTTGMYKAVWRYWPPAAIGRL